MRGFDVSNNRKGPHDRFVRGAPRPNVDKIAHAYTFEGTNNIEVAMAEVVCERKSYGVQE